MKADTKTGTLIVDTVLARNLGLKTKALRSLARRGVIPGLRVGDRWMFDRGTVEAALLERARKTPEGDESNR